MNFPPFRELYNRVIDVVKQCADVMSEGPCLIERFLIDSGRYKNSKKLISENIYEVIHSSVMRLYRFDKLGVIQTKTALAEPPPR